MEICEGYVMDKEAMVQIRLELLWVSFPIIKE
jgi:hypothetical protein